MNGTSKTIAIATAVAGLAVTPIALAQSGPEPKQKDQSQGEQQMMQGGLGMIPMMGMMTQMNEMMSTCNKVMQSMMPETPSQDGKEADKNG